MTEVIDAHLHLWDRRRFDYPWMRGMSLPTTSLPADLDATMTGAIVVEAGIVPDQRLTEVDWLTDLASASASGPIRGIVAAVDLTDPHLAEVLERLRARPLVVGVRDNFEGRPVGDLTRSAPALLTGLGTVLDTGLTVDLCVRSAQLGELDSLLTALVADRGAAEGLVLDHLGKPLPADSDFSHAQWAEAMAALSRQPGLHCKFSGLPGQVPGTVGPADALGLAERFAGDVIAAFGPDRTMYGSDHPVSTSGRGLTLRAWEQAAAAALRRVIDDTDFDAVMGTTAADFYLARRTR